MGMLCKKNVPLYYIYLPKQEKCPLLFWNFHNFFSIPLNHSLFLTLDVRKFQPNPGFSALDLEFSK